MHTSRTVQTSIFHLSPDTWQRAMAQAAMAVGVSEPNPRVGCVIISPRGELLGEGHTQAVGEAHAEVVALRHAAAAGHDVRGATVVVSLEPCSHHGRTPPCCEALVAAGVARVVVACEDPNPLVSGRGLAHLRAAGLAVEVLGGEFASSSRELNIGFFSRMTRRLPWVRMKAAVSLDGRTALPNGASQWITGDAARSDGHAWRKRAGAVLTGMGTVRDDNPRLDVRHVATSVQPLRVVVDSNLAIDPQAKILRAPGAALVYTTSNDAAKKAALQQLGHVEVAQMSANTDGKNDLLAMLQDLARRGINELHVEAGEKLNASLLREGLVDELLVYIAPRLLGDGRGLAALGTHTSLDQSLDFQLHQLSQVGGDVRLLLRRARTLSSAPPDRAR